jgi:TPR repeat protein
MKPEQIRIYIAVAENAIKRAFPAFAYGGLLREQNRWGVLCALLFLCASSHAAEIDLATEPPVVLAMLREAISLEQFNKDPAKMRRAVMLYCQASRFGSLEAQYRFGLLYLSGRGVRQNTAIATTLFSQAAQQGYAKAMDALEIVRLRPLELPPCLS